MECVALARLKSATSDQSENDPRVRPVPLDRSLGFPLRAMRYVSIEGIPKIRVMSFTPAIDHLARLFCLEQHDVVLLSVICFP